MEYLSTVIYVDDVEETLDFYYQAFGISATKLHESGQYGELNTGSVKLAFAAHPLAQSHFKQNYIRAQPKQPALGFEISFHSDNVVAAYTKAIQAGAEPLSPPVEKPWGHTVAYVRSIEGTLIALSSDIEPELE
ncbi:VOC family protein [Pseudoalteromonas tunicata]|jgi:uncharacterized glyoxalase superfamily protein PhnB|uniref:Glyoxalase family protein superfamily n=1 Tax=Pseudoalteromonas tunicata D2 TaxID=87626 RepID=A4C7F1_9GAMM|nr:VOC family protein [Pseudoalteromonas tunicata]ATC95875.1 hypothetical protein PTUN_a3567 [Pseudoalteromonas tunicata]AXT31419.1 glyoxalase [Pseudoalteromonas tunicata]EAR29905.1 glyoxalase family protein superfamily [Pseudoalteromonas tunicata D2]MDP4984839.1 VOC family protein [Pseudoalteromonas tunicata]